MLNWFRSLPGFPASRMGLLVSGGSMAPLTGLAVARHVQLNAKLGMDVRASRLQGVGRRPLLLLCKLLPSLRAVSCVSQNVTSRQSSLTMISTFIVFTRRSPLDSILFMH
jgi:hypothetical protein